MFENAEILRKYVKLSLDTSIYTEFHAGVDSDGQNPSKIYQKSRNHAEITKFRFDPMNLNIFSRRFQKSQCQYEKLAPNVEKSMISKCHLFFRGGCIYVCIYIYIYTHVWLYIAFYTYTIVWWHIAR